MKLLKSYMLIILVTTATVFSMYDEHSVAAGDPGSIPYYKPSSVSLGVLALEDVVPFDERCIVGPTSSDYSPRTLDNMIVRSKSPGIVELNALNIDEKEPEVSSAKDGVVCALKILALTIEKASLANAREVDAATNLLMLRVPNILEARQSLKIVLASLYSQHFEISRILVYLNEITTSS